jgi:flavin-dependent dehydrogenase
MVKKGGGLPNATVIWPSNPWTGRVMAPGTSRGTYTYTLGAGNLSYRLTVHLSSGNYVLKSAMPSWFKNERNTAARQNLLLLQRYVEAYAAAHGFGASYVWPVDPWTGAGMAAGDALGCYSYTGGGASYALKVRLTSGWSTPLGQLPVLGQLATPSGG